MSSNNVSFVNPIESVLLIGAIVGGGIGFGIGMEQASRIKTNDRAVSFFNGLVGGMAGGLKGGFLGGSLSVGMITAGAIALDCKVEKVAEVAEVVVALGLATFPLLVVPAAVSVIAFFAP